MGFYDFHPCFQQNPGQLDDVFFYVGIPNNVGISYVVASPKEATNLLSIGPTLAVNIILGHHFEALATN
jgi:hypothetical protein